MKYRALGKTGLKVSVLSLGGMMFGKFGNPDHDECVRIVHRALDAGINLIDTADVYSNGESEEIIGHAVAGRRDEVILATKFGQPAGTLNGRGASRRWIVRAVEGSLRRLGTDYLDLYQQHVPDSDVDAEETLLALDDLVRSGKVRMIGSSNFPAETIVEYRWAAERLGTNRMMTEQLPYNAFVRQAEPSVLPTCRRYGLGVLVWSPLNMGWLAGKYRRDQAPDEGTRAARKFARIPWVAGDDPSIERKYDLVEQLSALAVDAGVSLNHLAHAFVLEHPAVTSAIIGPRLPHHLEDALGAADVSLPREVLDRIDELCPPGRDVGPRDAMAVNANLRRAARRRQAGEG
ncbi:aldo/keto reductase [Streptosporangium sp. NPDC002544]|uniref:aldo/keto reductase n=1 Tax=Streptosporangium sp. NPDC002544 TaxID=3154538 RepID=UPI0033333034